MKRLDKDFDLTTTLIIIYLGLVTISIALYALIQIYVDDEATASSLLGWSATIFATIALLYTFNSWRDQKGSEVIANEAKLIIDKLNESLEISENLKYSLLGMNFDIANKHSLELNDCLRIIDTRINLLNILVNVQFKEIDENISIFQSNYRQVTLLFIMYSNKIISDNKVHTNDLSKIILNKSYEHELQNYNFKIYLANYALYKEYDKSA